MNGVVRSFFMAWHFLTVVPLPGVSQEGHHPRELAMSMQWYPVIGFVLGGLLVGSDFLLSAVFSPLLVNLLLLVFLILLTGALHQDGLADTLDGFGGGNTPDQRLAIMRDGRIGAIGATGLVLSLGLRYAGLVALSHPERASFLLCMPAIGRWSMVVAALSARYPRQEGGLAAPYLQALTFRDALVATLLLSIGVFWVWGPIQGGLILLGVMGIARLLNALATRVLGGVTGDILGATNEVVEIVFLLVCPLLLSVQWWGR